MGVLRVSTDVASWLQFGISRVIKSLEPYDKRLGWETWAYTKRCFLALIEGMVSGREEGVGGIWG